VKGEECKENAVGIKPERVQKILSAHGITSRRNAEKMILDGRVNINGIQATLGQNATFGLDDISVDGVLLTVPGEHIYLMLNKPSGYITTVSDIRGRQTVMDLITDINVRVYPVGRLDKDSEGLLIFTNDGDFANKIMHPSFDKQKTYEVEALGDVDKALMLLQEPIRVDEHTVHAIKVELSAKYDGGGVFRITISEGRNRQVRKMCYSCGLTVTSLKRVSIGSLGLGDLKSGQWRFLTKEEVSALG